MSEYDRGSRVTNVAASEITGSTSDVGGTTGSTSGTSGYMSNSTVGVSSTESVTTDVKSDESLQQLIAQRLSDIERVRQRMGRRTTTIAQLKAETRAILAQLQAV